MLLDMRLRLEYGLVLAASFVLRRLPLDKATAFSARAVRMIAPKTRRHRRALKNLEKAMPEKTPAEREAIALAMWDNIGRVIAEVFLLDRLVADPSRFEFENPGMISRYRNKMGPLVVAAPHMGNWEIAILPLHAINATPAGVYRILENPYVERWLHNRRAKLYPGGLFPAKSDAALATVMGIAAHLRAGGTVGMLADLVDWKGVEVPFFGDRVQATVAPAWLARRAGTRLCVGRCIRIGATSRFRIAFKELQVPRTAKPDEDIRAATEAIYREFCGWIAEHPEQWMWSNKRWRDHELPGGTPD